MTSMSRLRYSNGSSSKSSCSKLRRTMFGKMMRSQKDSSVWGDEKRACLPGMRTTTDRNLTALLTSCIHKRQTCQFLKEYISEKALRLTISNRREVPREVTMVHTVSTNMSICGKTSWYR